MAARRQSVAPMLEEALSISGCYRRDRPVHSLHQNGSRLRASAFRISPLIFEKDTYTIAGGRVAYAYNLYGRVEYHSGLRLTRGGREASFIRELVLYACSPSS